MKNSTAIKVRARIAAIRAHLDDIERILDQATGAAAVKLGRAKKKAAGKKLSRQIDLEELPPKRARGKSKSRKTKPAPKRGR